jgi:hypothetical protein
LKSLLCRETNASRLRRETLLQRWLLLATFRKIRLEKFALSGNQRQSPAEGNPPAALAPPGNFSQNSKFKIKSLFLIFLIPLIPLIPLIFLIFLISPFPDFGL